MAARTRRGSVSYSHSSSFNWDLHEIFRYKDNKCFIYDDKRIKWKDTYEILKKFTNVVLGQSGTWLSPGGNYKRFNSSNSDLILTWNLELGTLTFKGKVGDSLKELFINMCTMKESMPASGTGLEATPSGKDDLSLVNQAVPEVDRTVMDCDGVELNCKVVTPAIAGSTLEELQEFIDRSFQNVLPQNDNVNISFAQTIDSSTPYKTRATDCSASMEEQFRTFKENIESTMTALMAKVSEQTQIIDESKQELCKLTSDNLHLQARVTELEDKVFPKDKSTISINSSRNIDAANNTLVNKLQFIVSNEDNNIKEGPPSAYQTLAQNQTLSLRARNLNLNQFGNRRKASVPCPFLKRRGHCLKGSRCDFLHKNVYPTAGWPKFQLNHIKRPPFPNSNQSPFPVNSNYFPPIRYPMIYPPFPKSYPPPIMSPPFPNSYPPPLMSISTIAPHH